MTQASPSPPRKRLKRFDHTHTVRFVTFSCYHRLPLFKNDAIKQVFVDRLAALQQEQQIELFAWVLMPEHVHLLLRPLNPDDKLSRILQSLKRPVAERVIRRWRELDAPVLRCLKTDQGAVRFWQPGGGYDRNLYSSSECDEKLAYINRNPVKRGLVESEADWPWSSAGRTKRSIREGLLFPDHPIW